MCPINCPHKISPFLHHRQFGQRFSFPFTFQFNTMCQDTSNNHIAFMTIFYDCTFYGKWQTIFCLISCLCLLSWVKWRSYYKNLKQWILCYEQNKPVNVVDFTLLFYIYDLEIISSASSLPNVTCILHCSITKDVLW